MTGYDLPKTGDYVARAQGIPPKGRARAAPVIPPGNLRILYYGDSTCTRFTLAPRAQTLIGKFQRGGPVVPEYGHMELNHLFDGEKASVFHYAISGQRLVCDGAPTGAALRDRIYEAFCLPPTFRFDIMLIRAGTNDLKFHATGHTPIKVDTVFRGWRTRLAEIQAAFECKVVFLGAGITKLDGNILPVATTNHVLGGHPAPPTAVRCFVILF